MNVYYVYEHWRPDTNTCFYVGKGKNKRAWDMKNMRNRHHMAIVSKLTSMGLSVDVRIIVSNLSDETALSVEKDKIAFYGVENLANMTEGGEGMSNPTDKTRKKISESQKKRFSRPEEREILSAQAKGRIISEKTRKKLSAAAKGRKISDDVKLKIKIAAKGRQIPAHVREAQKLAVTGKKRAPFSQETLKKMSEAAKIRERIKRERRAA
jgi:hypothetical protein